ncbi:MAG: phosphate acyltransferase PlsX [Chloroflexi bacterium]|nr:phosphate acyltransferase PlsX [Chloroflexota bacterium]
MRIVVDALGSDDRPGPDVAGAVMAAREYDVTIILVGDQVRIEAELARHNTTDLAIECCHAADEVTMTDKPADIVKGKPNSSLHVGMRLVRDGQADAFVTAGNTGAVLAVATLRAAGIGRIRSVKRPGLGLVFPIKERPFLIDSGANAECKAQFLLQFGIMGSVYVERVFGVQNPRVGLISIGEEAGKGTELVQETAALLQASNLNFVGNIEPKEFMFGAADVAVTDGFSGNLIMKTSEAIARYMSEVIREELKANPISAVGGLLAKPAFSRMRKQLDPEEVGGAPLLGVNGVVIIGHGRSQAYGIKQAVGQARLVVQSGAVAAITAGIRNS